MGRWTDAARLVRSAMDKAGDCLTDAQAAESAALFMPWRAETEYQAGDRVTYYGTLYKCLQAHTSRGSHRTARACGFALTILQSSGRTG